MKREYTYKQKVVPPMWSRPGKLHNEDSKLHAQAAGSMKRKGKGEVEEEEEEERKRGRKLAHVMKKKKPPWKTTPSPKLPTKSIDHFPPLDLGHLDGWYVAIPLSSQKDPSQPSNTSHEMSIALATYTPHPQPRMTCHKNQKWLPRWDIHRCDDRDEFSTTNIDKMPHSMPQAPCHKTINPAASLTHGIRIRCHKKQ